MAVFQTLEEAGPGSGQLDNLVKVKVIETQTISMKTISVSEAECTSPSPLGEEQVDPRPGPAVRRSSDTGGRSPAPLGV